MVSCYLHHRPRQYIHNNIEQLVSGVHNDVDIASFQWLLLRIRAIPDEKAHNRSSANGGLLRLFRHVHYRIHIVDPVNLSLQFRCQIMRI